MRKFPKPNSPDLPAAEAGKRQDLSRKSLGNYGENLVARTYQGHGFEVVARQWRGVRGELDLVLCKDNLIVFCEVKTRKTLDFGGAEVVGRVKQLRLRQTAAAFLSQLDDFVPEVRFDVAVVCNSRVEVIADAF